MVRATSPREVEGTPPFPDVVRLVRRACMGTLPVTVGGRLDREAVLQISRAGVGREGWDPRRPEMG